LLSHYEKDLSSLNLPEHYHDLILQNALTDFCDDIEYEMYLKKVERSKNTTRRFMDESDDDYMERIINTEGILEVERGEFIIMMNKMNNISRLNEYVKKYVSEYTDPEYLEKKIFSKETLLTEYQKMLSLCFDREKKTRNFEGNGNFR